MRILLVAAALALVPVASAQMETGDPCATGAEACADANAPQGDTGAPGEVGTGQEVPASEDPAGGGQGGGVQDIQPYNVNPYLPWIVLSVVLVAALVAALGYTVRRESIDHLGRRR